MRTYFLHDCIYSIICYNMNYGIFKTNEWWDDELKRIEGSVNPRNAIIDRISQCSVQECRALLHRFQRNEPPKMPTADARLHKNRVFRSVNSLVTWVRSKLGGIRPEGNNVDFANGEMSSIASLLHSLLLVKDSDPSAVILDKNMLHIPTACYGTSERILEDAELDPYSTAYALLNNGHIGAAISLIAERMKSLQASNNAKQCIIRAIAHMRNYEIIAAKEELISARGLTNDGITKAMIHQGFLKIDEDADVDKYLEGVLERLQRKEDDMESLLTITFKQLEEQGRFEEVRNGINVLHEFIPNHEVTTYLTRHFLSQQKRDKK